MTKKQSTLYGVIVLIIGIIGGVSGTAFSVGAEQQRIRGALVNHSEALAMLRIEDKAHEQEVGQELDRYSKLISVNITALQTSISKLTETVSELRSDVHVLQALIERIEFKSRNN